MDLADDFIGLFHIQWRRNGQDATGLEQHSRCQPQQEAGERDAEQPPDQAFVQQLVGDARPGRQFWPRAAGQTPAQVIGGPEQTEGDKEQGKQRMGLKGLGAEGQHIVRGDQQEPDQQGHHGPMHRLERGTARGQRGQQ